MNPLPSPHDAAINTSRRHLLSCGGALLGGAALSQLAPSTLAAEQPSSAIPNRATFSITQHGAKGDGQTDDTAAAQTAIDSALKAGGGRVHFPAGRYRLTRSLNIHKQVPIDITGDGYSTILLQEQPEPVLVWDEKTSAICCSVRDMQLLASKADKPAEVPMIHCRNGAERSTLFANLLLSGEGALMGSGVRVERVIDTVTFLNCLFWGVAGVGLHLPRGSEVRVIGSRITGLVDSGQVPHKVAPSQGIGILMTGDLGGIHVVTTDIIAFETGMQIGIPDGAVNRETFITHATFDSCLRGLWIRNAAYVSITGCWAASSDEAQILLDSPNPAITQQGCLLVVSGGTISNGGAYGRKNTSHGLVARAGSFVLNGVTFWHNKGAGILIEGDGVRDYSINGCQLRHNGVGASLRGQHFICAQNSFIDNATHFNTTDKRSHILDQNIFNPPQT